MSKIIDVSKYQGTIDWSKVAADGVEEVIIRLSLGYGDMDSRAVENAKGAEAAGITVSYYHFAYPDTRNGGTVQKDAESEAKYFTGLFGQGNSHGLPSPHRIAVDLENWSYDPPKDSPLNKDEYLLWVQTFLAEVKQQCEMECMVYSYKSYINEHIPSDHNLGSYPLWIANYSEVDSPSLPNGWTSYALWQYTSKGSVNGITGNVDMNKKPA